MRARVLCDAHSDRALDCIQTDLDALWKTPAAPPERTVWMVHTPPYNTCLDVLASGSHVGSVALTKQIGRTLPLLTLHGHIHETVDITGKFLETIGSSPCYAAGNKHKALSVAYILVSTAEPHAGVRKKAAPGSIAAAAAAVSQHRKSS